MFVFQNVLKIICGIEIIRKRQIKGIQCVHPEVGVIYELLGVGP